MERDNLNQRAEQIGEISLAHFRHWKDKYPLIGDGAGRHDRPRVYPG